MLRPSIRELTLLATVVALAIGWGLDHREKADRIDCYGIVLDRIITPTEIYSGVSEEELNRAMSEVWPDGFPFEKYIIRD